MAFRNIDTYGIIGDLHSAALVGSDGSIDWCCLPRFDSPSVFAAILDDQKGGYFRIHTTPEERCKQMYLPDTNVLVTRFLSEEGVGEVVDFMPWHNSPHKMQAIVRIARCVRGTACFTLECAPAFDYARQSHEISVDRHGAIFHTPTLTLNLSTSVALDRLGTGGVRAQFNLHEGEQQSFVLQSTEEGDTEIPADLNSFTHDMLLDTLHRWREWASQCTYTGRWREIVMRSALLLKLLIYEPTGAIIAAPTCSLPEAIGGVRNWDYRYTWIRDAAFSMFALLSLGYTREATRFMEWLQQRASEDQDTGPLQVMYRIDGSSELAETTLDHLSGYRDSRPVRLGNDARGQLQLDIYGELVDSIYLYNKHAEPISYDFWIYLRKIAYWVSDNWQRPDHSIWEVRSQPQQFTYSKLQCWVALDRSLRIARQRNLPFDVDRIRDESHKIFNKIMEEGWNGKSFVQTLGGDRLDATSLLFTQMRFVPASDRRMTATLDLLLKELVSDSLVYRYRTDGPSADGLPGGEGTFSACTFWLVEVLSRAGRVREARYIFEKMLTYANHLGLFGEEIGAAGQTLGNFPQAFTHLGLITAALDLNENLEKNQRH